jgi:hypothetical protein
MKARNGYVSNSSSSSFIVYGRELDYYEALERMADNGNNVMCILDRKGTSGEVEDFVFRMTNRRMNILESNGIDIEQMNGRYLLVMKEWFNDGGVMDITEPLTGGRIFEITKDDSSPTSDSDNDRNFARWVKSRRGK